MMYSVHPYYGCDSIHIIYMSESGLVLIKVIFDFLMLQFVKKVDINDVPTLS